jgi:hypothetical protein
MPSPTIGGGSLLENNCFTQVNNYNVYDNFLGRMDVNFSSKNRFFVSAGEAERAFPDRQREALCGGNRHSSGSEGPSDLALISKLTAIKLAH